MNLLRTLLEGEAHTLVAGLRLEEKNYEIALTLLRQTYGNKGDYIRRLHMELANLKRCSSLSDTKRFHLELERLARELEAAGEDIEGPPIYLMLEKKLFQPFLRVILEEKAKKLDKWDTTQFRKILGEETRKESAIKEVMAEYGLDREHTREPGGRFKRFQGGAAVNATVVQPRRNVGKERQVSKEWLSPNSFSTARGYRPGPAGPERNWKNRFPSGMNRQPARAGGSFGFAPSLCAFCDGPHWHDRCEKYRTLATRYTVARERKLCFKCLKKHVNGRCQRPSKCYKCYGEHPTALCRQDKQQERSTGTINPVTEFKRKDDQTTKDQFREVGSTPAQCNAVRRDKSKVLLRTAEVTIFNPSDPKKSTIATVFIDDGSERSFIKSDVAKRLELPVLEREECYLTSFGERNPKRYTSNVVKLGFLGVNGDSYVCSLNEMEFMVKAMPIVALNSVDEDQLRGRKLKFPSKLQQPDIMLGMDVRHDLNIRDESEKLPSGFTLSNSRLGRMISGAGQWEQPNSPWAQVTFTGSLIGAVLDKQQKTPAEGNDLEDRMRSFFGLNIIGMDDDNTQLDKDEVMKTFRRNLTFKGGRYECGLPWNERMKDLPTNYKQARARLCSTIRKLREMNLVKPYQEILDDWEKQGITERVHDPGLFSGAGPVHYLPHRPVLREDKATTKIRIVLDASAKPRGQRGVPSLNECLHTGPLLQKQLVGILLRWRTMRVVILADLEKAFLQLAVREQDRDATRFLWLEDAENADLQQMPFLKCVVFRFCRVSFGLTTSPFLLNATIREHLAFYDTQLPLTIMENLYVDNILIKANNEREVPKLCSEVIELFRQGGMKLREFYCSHPKAIESMPKELLAADQRKTKVLGINWTNDDEKIHFLFQKFEEKCTKRAILGHLARVYDPLGLVGPALLPAKIFLQTLYEADLKWDDAIDDDRIQGWAEIMSGWEGDEAKHVTIDFPRRVQAQTEAKVEIHCFTDASGRGLGIAIYYKVDATPRMVNLIFAKSLVKPSRMSDNQATIPKLELQAITLGVKALKFVLQELQLDNSQATIWTDSLCSIERIKEHTKYDRFVENRLAKIRGQYRIKHLASADNPADVASRGVSPRELQSNSLWRHGPRWIREEEKLWPIPLKEYSPDEEFKDSLEDDVVDELKVLTTTDVESPEWLDTSRFSSWKKLKATMAYVIRFTKALLWRCKERVKENAADTRQPRVEVTMSARELAQAEMALIKQAQNCFPPSDERRRTLRIFEENGILKCGGRLEEVNIPEESKFPIYLPPQSWVAKLIVMDMHVKLKHPSNNTLLAQLRERYWIPQGRKFTRNAIQSSRHGCLNCRRHKLKPYSYPEMAPLPRERLAMIKPFEHTGVDYFGPVRLKGQEKCYVALYTCLVVRAIHLELATDYSAAAFLRTFRKFCARRGWPKLVMSDNAANFVLGAEFIREEWRQQVAGEAARSGVTWRFITPRAPWMGGSWERLVGITKAALLRSIGKCLLPREEFDTLICEVEGVVNSRPLTVQSEELLKPLRPVDFLMPFNRVELDLPWSDEDPDDPDYEPRIRKKGELQLMMRWAIKRIDRFWDKWKTEYLHSLRERDRGSEDVPPRNPKEGDVVLIEDDNAPRSKWDIGRVTKLFLGRDGNVRVANITRNGKNLQRAINQLYLLEVNSLAVESGGTQMAEIVAAAAMDSSKGVVETEGPNVAIHASTESSLPPTQRNATEQSKPSTSRRSPIRRRGPPPRRGKALTQTKTGYTIPKRNPLQPSRIMYNDATRKYTVRRMPMNRKRIVGEGLETLLRGMGGENRIRRELKEQRNPEQREKRIQREKIRFMAKDARRVAREEKKAAKKRKKAGEEAEVEPEEARKEWEMTRAQTHPERLELLKTSSGVQLELLKRKTAEDDSSADGDKEEESPLKQRRARRYSVSPIRTEQNEDEVEIIGETRGRQGGFRKGHKKPKNYSISPLRKTSGGDRSRSPVSKAPRSRRRLPYSISPIRQPSQQEAGSEPRRESPPRMPMLPRMRSPTNAMLDNLKKCRKQRAEAEARGGMTIVTASPGFKIFMDHTLLTHCDPNDAAHQHCPRDATFAVLGLAYDGLKQKHLRGHKATCLLQAFAFNWLGRMHMKQFARNWHQLVADSKPAEVETTVRKLWSSEIQHHRNPLQTRHLVDVLQICMRSCVTFAEEWKERTYGPTELKHVLVHRKGSPGSTILGMGAVVIWSVEAASIKSFFF